MMEILESLRKGLNKSKKVLKNSAVTLTLASTLASCGADNNTMSFDRMDQTGKMSISYAGNELKKFDIEVRKLKDWIYQAEIDEAGWWFNKKYSGNLDAIIADMINDVQEQVWLAWVSSTASGDSLQDLASEKLLFFKEEYKKFLENKQLDKQEILYTPEKR